MRTVADLREALIACEQPPPPVEHFLANVPGVAVSDEISIVPAPVRRRRRPALWLTAVAVAAAVTAGSVVLINGVGGHGHAVSGPASHSGLGLRKDDLVLPISFDAAAKVTVEGISLASDGSYINVHDAAGHVFMLFLDTSHESHVQGLHREQVDINGSAAIYSDEAAGAGAASASASPGASIVATGSASYSSTLTRYLNWDYSPSRTLVVETLPPSAPISKDGFLAFARAIRLGTRTQTPMPFTISEAPAGLRLTAVNMVMPGGDQAWSFQVGYQRVSGSHSGYAITVSPVPTVTAKTEDAIEKTVSGRSAHWLRVGRDGWAALTVDLGSVYLNVAEVGGQEPSQPPYETFAAIAESVTVAPGSADLNTWLEGKTWFDAAKALPLGS